MRSSVVKAVNFVGTTSPTSLFLFPVACASSLFSAFASRTFFNKRDSSIGTFQFLNKHRPLISAALEQAPHLRHEKFNKRRGAYSSNNGTTDFASEGSLTIGIVFIRVKCKLFELEGFIVKILSAFRSFFRNDFHYSGTDCVVGIKIPFSN